MVLKKMPDDPKKVLDNCPANVYISVQLNVRDVFWDLRKDPRKNA